MDVSSYTISFYIGNGNNIILTKTDTLGIDMTDASTGTIYTNITPEDTNSLGVGSFNTELWFELDSKPEIWYKGALVIKPTLYVPS